MPRNPRTHCLVALAIMLLTLTGCAGSSERTESEPTPRGDCNPAAKLVTDGPKDFPFDAQERTYLLHVPPDYTGRQYTPVIFDFHGWGSSKEAHEADSSLGARGAKRGFIVITPDALGTIREFNMFGSAKKADDFGFVHALLAEVRRQLCIDKARVFAAGHSNGSAFTGFLSCRQPYDFAAVAMVSATIPSSCPAGRTPSVLAIAGTADPQVPYDGGNVGGGPTLVPPAPDTFAGYLTKYTCDRARKITKPEAGVIRREGMGCENHARVVLDTVIGGTHPWPGGPVAKADPANSAAGQTYDATDAILRFFESPTSR